VAADCLVDEKAGAPVEACDLIGHPRRAELLFHSS
jgi:hypothetical protein